MREFREGSARPEKEEIDRRAIEDLQLILTNPLISKDEKNAALSGAIVTWEKTEYPGDAAPVDMHVDYGRRLARIVCAAGLFADAIIVLQNLIKDLKTDLQDEYVSACEADLAEVEKQLKAEGPKKRLEDTIRAIEKPN